MAFVTTEGNSVRLAGFEPALILVHGTYANAGGGTGGIISPGYTNASGTLTAVAAGSPSLGARKILFGTYTTGTNDAVTVKEVIAFNSTRGRDESTITTSADSTGTYMFLCYDNGA